LHTHTQGIEVVRLEGDLTFITAGRIKDFISSLVLMAPPVAGSGANRSENIRIQVRVVNDDASMFMKVTKLCATGKNTKRKLSKLKY